MPLVKRLAKQGENHKIGLSSHGAYSRHCNHEPQRLKLCLSASLRRLQFISGLSILFHAQSSYVSKHQRGIITSSPFTMVREISAFRVHPKAGLVLQFDPNVGKQTHRTQPPVRLILRTRHKLHKIPTLHHTRTRSRESLADRLAGTFAQYTLPRIAWRYGMYMIVRIGTGIPESGGIRYEPSLTRGGI